MKKMSKARKTVRNHMNNAALIGEGGVTLRGLWYHCENLSMSVLRALLKRMHKRGEVRRWKDEMGYWIYELTEGWEV